MIATAPPVPGIGSTRILFDLRPVRIPISGVARYCIELVSALREGADAPQVTGLFYGDRRSNEGLRRTTRLDGIPAATTAGAKTVMAGMEFLPVLGKLLVRGEHDLVHETYFANISERGGCPKVVTIHDVIPIDRPEHVSRRNRFFSRRNLFRQARQARQIICVSEYTRRKVMELTDADPAKITVVPCGVTPPPARIDMDFIAARGLAGKRFLLFVGNLEPRKNIDLIARALVRQRESADDVLLVVAGHMNYLAQPILDACGAALGSRFLYLGSVTEEQKAALLASALALVLPSLYEGFGIPVVEAYQAKCPVLLADNSSLSELAVDQRQLFDASSVDALSDRLQQLASGASWIARSVATAATGMERYSWSSVARRTLDVYRRALEH